VADDLIFFLFGKTILIIKIIKKDRIFKIFCKIIEKNGVKIYK